MVLLWIVCHLRYELSIWLFKVVKNEVSHQVKKLQSLWLILQSLLINQSNKFTFARLIK